MKQLAKLLVKIRWDIEHFVFSELPASDNLASTGKVEKMQDMRDFIK